MILQKQQIIEGYTVVSFIKQGIYAETYRVKSAASKLCFMKLMCCAKLKREQYTGEGRILEVEMVKQLNHPRISQYIDSGSITLNGQRYVYLVKEHISGETLSQMITRERQCSVYDTKQIAIRTLEALKYLHTLPNPIIHSRVNLQNVMLDLGCEENNDVRLIDFGNACYLKEEQLHTSWQHSNPFYLAPECFNGVYSVQSDLYAVGAMIYQLLFGLLPWYIDVSQSEKEKWADVLLDMRKKPLKMPNLNLFELDEQLINVMQKALSQDIDNRFQTAEEFIKALKGEVKVSASTSSAKTVVSGSNATTKSPKKKGNGFADVAGMQSVKYLLTNTVIRVLQDSERAKQYGVKIPNGMLLYGPPGCGKTFIAERFAEETGYNYMYVKSSDLASIYVHGSQEKIGKLFDEARKNTPTILCFDEFDALVPNRNRMNSASQAGEVNEFLSQLNNCGDDGIFVIASTNKPDLIDPAILRRGRIDQLIYIPLPDKAARKAMLELYMKKRPYDFGIDYDRLADMTEGYVASDMAFIVNDAAGVAFMNNEKITEQHLINAIQKNRPSLTKEVIASYEKLREKMEGSSSGGGRPRVGFK